MDLYDPATFQSVEGLRWVLDLCARFRVASTMFLSGRLSVDKAEHKKFLMNYLLNIFLVGKALVMKYLKH